MSLHDERMAKQPKVNQSIYYAWIENLKVSTEDISSFESSVSRFFDYNVDCSILDVKFVMVASYISRFNGNKPSVKRNIINDLKNFFGYIEEHHKTNWDFSKNDLTPLIPSTKVIKEATSPIRPLLFKELYTLFKQLNILKDSEEKWKEAYIVFQLMFDYQIGKAEISNLNNKTYNPETGEFKYKKVHIKLSDEFRDIFMTQGLTIGYYSEDTILNRMKLLCSLVGRNITQEDIWATSELYQIICPGCGERIKNSINLLGAVKVDILNFDGAILCKNCLVNLNDD